MSCSADDDTCGFCGTPGSRPFAVGLRECACDAGGHTLCGDCVVYWDLAWNWDATELDRCVTYADGLRVARALMA